MRLIVALALLAGVSVAAPVPKEMKKNKTPVHLGTWKPTSGSEWFAFDAEGNMKAWTNGSANSPALYTYAVDADPDGTPWRMTWTSKGSDKPSYQVVFVVDGDGMKLSYTSFGGPPQPKPGPDTKLTYTFTREAAK